MSSKAIRGKVFHFKETATFQTLPRKKNNSEGHEHFEFIEDGLLVLEDGKVKAVGQYADLKKTIGDTPVTDHSGKLIMPGFIDTHIHSTQKNIIAAYGEKLLEWLENYAFPAEIAYEDKDFARKDLNGFIDHLLMNGTTTAVAFGPVYHDACDIFFEELQKRNMKMITGLTIMDTQLPDGLNVTTQGNYDASQKLIEKWHGQGRASYCITPRFALCCSEEMLELSATLNKDNPGVYMQTHLNENVNEIMEAQRLFPWSKNYLDVYDHYGLVTDKTVFAHCIHMKEAELERFKETGAITSWCPLSNDFIGSGLFDLETYLKYTDRITLGTDMGGGYSFSMLQVLGDAYNVAMLKSYKLATMPRLFLATLGAAKSLGIDDKVGNFSVGKEADFIVVDPDEVPITKLRCSQVEDIFEYLFVMMTIGGERNIVETYLAGNLSYSQS